MTDYTKYINALRKCANEHENDRTFTGHVIVADLCRDTANLLETLEQESCEDWYDVPSDEMTLEQARQAVKDLRNKLAEYLNLGVDAVNRKELLKIYECRFLELQKMKHLKDNKGAEDRQMGINYCINILKEMPPIKSKPKMGHWICDDKCNEHGHCSECGYGSVDLVIGPHNYCRNCGAKMVEHRNCGAKLIKPQESEE